MPSREAAICSVQHFAPGRRPHRGARRVRRPADAPPAAQRPERGGHSAERADWQDGEAVIERAERQAVTVELVPEGA